MQDKEKDQTVNSMNDPIKQIDQSEEIDIGKERSLTDLLVVDDEEIMRNLLEDVLSEEGYKVRSFERAEEVLEKVDEGKADIVITDLKMKGIGGIELLKKIKENDPGIDVIVITGYASVETAVESMKFGAADYLVKPFNIDQIRIVVNKTLEHRILKRKAGESLFYKRLSQIDGTTELFNHRSFQELLKKEIARAKRESQPVSLIMLDIDDFSVFNDENGHSMGDLALRKVSYLLKNNSRLNDFIARYGGEEFAIIAPNTDKKSTKGLATRIRKAVEETKFDKEEILPNGRFTVSVGVAEYPSDASSSEELIEKANQALCQAKKEGKNKVCIYNDGA